MKTLVLLKYDNSKIKTIKSKTKPKTWYSRSYKNGRKHIEMKYIYKKLQI
jgi:hypothetical protein